MTGRKVQNTLFGPYNGPAPAGPKHGEKPLRILTIAACLLIAGRNVNCAMKYDDTAVKTTIPARERLDMWNETTMIRADVVVDEWVRP